MDTEEVREGAIRLRVPAAHRKERGPGTHEADVFYNPAMALNRDLSLLVLQTRAREGCRVLDGLAATGARGLRMAHAVPAAEVQLNDWNPLAVRLVEENAKLNGLTVEATRRNLGALLWERTWDWVDVDPFGSPSVFVDAATRAVRNDGVLALTATDATALYGVYPKACQRRYLSHPLRSEIGHEVALRILAGFATRQAAKHELAVTPFLAHATDHYYRAYLCCRRGAGRADEALSRIGHAWLCPACGARGVQPEKLHACNACGGRVRNAGPLWTGDLQDAGVIENALGHVEDTPLAKQGEATTALGALLEEAGAPPLFFDLQEAVSRAGVETPKRARFLEALRAAGFVAKRSHVSPMAVKTDATAREIGELLRSGI